MLTLNFLFPNCLQSSMHIMFGALVNFNSFFTVRPFPYLNESAKILV